MKANWFSWALVALALGLLAVSQPPTLSMRKASSEACGSCHEISRNVNLWHQSTHRNVPCTDCHDSSTMGNARRVSDHFSGEVPDQIRLSSRDVQNMTQRCRRCHQQEYASWAAGPHSTTYQRIFTNAEHNAKRPLMDDCLRCHGMHFEGSIRDVAAPEGTKGPWHLVRPELANMATIPCMTCHSVHRAGAPSQKLQQPAMTAKAVPTSLGFFDRRDAMNFPAVQLRIPQMFAGAEPVRMGADPRDAICYQCHAPRASRQVGSGDDRTPHGVHEGLGCVSCHLGHNQSAKESCVRCHPQFSNCGLNVEKMDTTFASGASRHNIHTVACADCHQDSRISPREKAFRASPSWKALKEKAGTAPPLGDPSVDFGKPVPAARASLGAQPQGSANR